MTEFTALEPKGYSYLMGDNDKNKYVKGTKKCVMKLKLKFKDYKNCLEANQLEKEINNLKKVTLMWIVLEEIIKTL